MKSVWTLVGLLSLTGCASRPPVDCDWKLRPINPPEKKVDSGKAAGPKAVPPSKEQRP